MLLFPAPHIVWVLCYLHIYVIKCFVWVSFVSNDLLILLYIFTKFSLDHIAAWYNTLVCRHLPFSGPADFLVITNFFVVTSGFYIVFLWFIYSPIFVLNGLNYMMINFSLLHFCSVPGQCQFCWKKTQFLTPYHNLLWLIVSFGRLSVNLRLTDTLIS